jgi:hypothetical protein
MMWVSRSESSYYLHSKNNPAIANATPASRCHDGASRKNKIPERRASSDFAFNIGGTWKLSKQLNLLFAGGRDIVGDTTAMAYIGFQILTK